MSSDRPETSVPLTSTRPPPESFDLSAPLLITASQYIPHVVDLVTPTHRARDTAKLYIPSAFLQSEAIDSSLLLGHGASFTVTRQAVPPGSALQIVYQKDMGGWKSQKVVQAPERPRHVVYKTARVEFQANGEPATPKDRRALQSVLTEFHALLHPSLLAHPHIIDFLGLAWGSNHANPRHRLPVLVVEYGDRGTLADVQLRGSPLSDLVKKEICLGIALGLETLHQNGIIHGDLKPENIIMCTRKDGRLVPKLADFGFAIIESSESSEVTIGGTRTWRAPESFSYIPVSKLKFTDIYSFGLVAWSIAIDGEDPFALMLSTDLQDASRFLEIDRLKSEDKLLHTSKLDAWIVRWYLLSQLRAELSRRANDRVQPLDGHHSELVSPPDQALSQRLVRYLLSPQSQLEQIWSSRETAPNIPQMCRQREYFKDLETIFACTLCRSPDSRNLEVVIDLLKDDEVTNLTNNMLSLTQDSTASGSEVLKVDPEQAFTTGISWENTQPLYQITNTAEEVRHLKFTPIKAQPPATTNHKEYWGKIDWSDLGFKSRKFSWQQTRDLDPIVQTFVVNTLYYLDDSPSRFALGAFTMNGYGVPSDADRALEFLVKAADHGHSIAQAYLYRFFTACQKDIPPKVPILEYLRKQALGGSRIALLDLKSLDSKEGKRSREMLKHGYGGVGASWFHEDQWLEGLSQPKLMSQDFVLSSLGPRAALHDMLVNTKGDHLIHAAAAVGAYGLVMELLNDIKVDVNQQNANGETPLLCACRSGHPGIVMLLLNSGANASIQSKNGESPLHWLIAFDDDINPAAVGNDLIKRGGANVNAFTTQRISHSVFPSTIDVDFQMEGTPLMWAVHDNKPKLVSFLLSVGSNPDWRFTASGISPLEWAAHYHHKDCLQLMIEHMEQTVELPVTVTGQQDLRFAVVYGPLVQKAVHASDKFSMMLRHGQNYMSRLRSTLEFLQEKTRLIRFSIGGENETLLHFAALKAHEEACEIILDRGWRIEEINKPAGPYGMTPLLEAVRWNRRKLFQLLLNRGADPIALAISPYNLDDRSWSALHVLAEQGHDDDLDLVDDLVAAGVPVDGESDRSLETPLHVAIRRNAFRLAAKLLSHGASINIARLRSSFIVSPHPLTGLGHIIALNARQSFNSLRYMMGSEVVASKEGAITDFIVEPARMLSALHLCAIVPHGLSYAQSGAPLTREDFDWETNRAIAHELLEWFCQPSQLDLKSQLQGKTALHLAAEFGNYGVAEELVKLGADKTIKCDTGESPAEIARRVFKTGRVLDKLLAWLD